MCTLLDMVEKETAERVEKETAERVEKETRYKMLYEFMKNSGTSMEEAMSLLGFSKDEAGDYVNYQPLRSA